MYVYIICIYKHLFTNIKYGNLYHANADDDCFHDNQNIQIKISLELIILYFFIFLYSFIFFILYL